MRLQCRRRAVGPSRRLLGMALSAMSMVPLLDSRRATGYPDKRTNLDSLFLFESLSFVLIEVYLRRCWLPLLFSSRSVCAVLGGYPSFNCLLLLLFFVSSVPTENILSCQCRPAGCPLYDLYQCSCPNLTCPDGVSLHCSLMIYVLLKWLSVPREPLILPSRHCFWEPALPHCLPLFPSSFFFFFVSVFLVSLYVFPHCLFSPYKICLFVVVCAFVSCVFLPRYSCWLYRLVLCCLYIYIHFFSLFFVVHNLAVSFSPISFCWGKLN